MRVVKNSMALFSRSAFLSCSPSPRRFGRHSAVGCKGLCQRGDAMLCYPFLQTMRSAGDGGDGDAAVAGPRICRSTGSRERVHNQAVYVCVYYA